MQNHGNLNYKTSHLEVHRTGYHQTSRIEIRDETYIGGVRKMSSRASEKVVEGNDVHVACVEV
jgi:hypothetical protein